MKDTRNIRTITIAALACLAGTFLFAALAFAEEAGQGGAVETYSFLHDWLPEIVNFAIIAGVVIYFMKTPARDFFKNRAAEIAKAMEESKQARERAAFALAEMEEKIKELEAEAARLIADAQQRGEKDRQALLDEGRKIVSDIQAQVEQGVALEVQRAKGALAAEAALLSLDLAEGSITKNIGAEDQARIVKEYVAGMGGTK